MLILGTISLLTVAAVACGGETKTVEVPGETIIIEKEVIKEVPGETIVVEKEVIKEVEVPGETVVVEKEKIVEVEVPGETVVVEKEKIVEVEVPGETVVVEKFVEKELSADQKAALDERYGGQLRVVAQGSMSQLDPFALKGAVDLTVAQHMWEPLFDIDITRSPGPRIADSWTVSSDGLKWVITIRDGLAFTDGSVITTDDVIPSVLRWFDSRGAGGKNLQNFAVEDPLEKVDNLTFTFTLAEPFGAAFASWGGGGSANYIFPKEVAEIDPTIDMGGIDENYYNLTSGPYKLKEWVRGAHIILDRYDDYQPRNDSSSWRVGRQNAYMDELMFIEVPSPETAIAGLKTALYDVVEGAGADFIDTLTDDPNIGVFMSSPWRGSLNVNLLEESWSRGGPHTNLKVRQAIQANIDIDDFMGVVGPKKLWWKCSSLFGVCGGVTGKGAPWGLESRAADPYYDQNDPVLAKELLAESGYAGEVIHIMAPTDYAIITPFGPVMKATLEEIGITVEMPAVNWANLLSRLGDTDWDMFTTYEASPQPSPLFMGQLDQTYAWMRGWPDQTLPTLKAQFLREPDPDKQMEIIDEIQRFMYWDGLPFFFLGMLSGPNGYLNTVHGIGKDQVGAQKLWYGNTWKEK
jgi:peptide/nickel transport system substrate-binding protein